MAAVNTKGVLMGGLAAGVVMNALDYVSSNVILGARWTAELAAALVGGMIYKDYLSNRSSPSAIQWVEGDVFLPRANFRRIGNDGQH